MAVGGTDVIKDISENLLSCDVCQEFFDSHSRAPRILKCFHTFCGECLEKLVQNDKVKCPMCRQVTAVEEKIPMDPTRVTLLDTLGAVKSQKSVVCEVCDEGLRSEYRCQTCTKFLCWECCSAHRRARQTKGHTVTSIADAAKDPSKFVKSIENCSRHPDMKLDMYCETCKLSVCTKCTFVMHKEGHQIVEVEKVVEEVKEKVLSLCEELEEMAPTFRSKLGQSKASLQQVKDNIVEAEDVINAAISQIIVAIQEKKTELIEELRSRAKADLLSHDEQVSTFQSLLSMVETTAGHGRRLVSMNLATHILEQVNHIQEVTANLKEELSTSVDPAPAYEVETEKPVGIKDTVSGYVHLADPESVRRAKRLTCPAPHLESRNVMLPGITLDRDHCGSGCRVKSDLSTLTNDPVRVRESSPFTFKFPGTCGVTGLTESWYWQADVKISSSESGDYCRVGVITDEIRHSGSGDGYTVKILDHGDIMLFVSIGDTLHVGYYCRRNGLFKRRFGFLRDALTSRLTVIDVSGGFVLGSGPLNTSRPLWPMVSVSERGLSSSFDISITVESGQKIHMLPSLTKVLKNILED